MIAAARVVAEINATFLEENMLLRKFMVLDLSLETV